MRLSLDRFESVVLNPLLSVFLQKYTVVWQPSKGFKVSLGSREIPLLYIFLTCLKKVVGERPLPLCPKYSAIILGVIQGFSRLSENNV